MQAIERHRYTPYPGAALALGLILLFCTVSVPIWYSLAFARNDAVIGRGVELPGLPLGGMTKDQAVAAVHTWEQRHVAQPLQVRLDQRVWTLAPVAVKWRIDAESVVAEALSIGRRGSLAVRWHERWQSLWHGYTINVQSPDSERYIVSWLQQLEAAVYQAPRNAYRDVKTGVVVKEKLGRQLDVQASKSAIELAFAHLDTQVDLAVRQLPPQVSADMAANVDVSAKLASFSTKFNAAMQNRVANIKLASELIDGTILQPGQVFSFNGVVGPREKRTGFREAPELLKGDTVTGIGGGVCQVSSTLYNAVLLSNLTVLERYKHSAVLGYVGAGRDATVSYGQLDFRFRNTLDHPIVIRSTVVNNQITVELRGQKALPYKVQLFSEVRQLPYKIVEHVDTKLPPGKKVVTKEGKAGQLVTIRKAVTYTGKPAGRPVVVSKNLYEAVPQVVRVGPALQQKTSVSPGQTDGDPGAAAVSILDDYDTKPLNPMVESNTPAQTEPVRQEKQTVPIDPVPDNEE